MKNITYKLLKIIKKDPKESIKYFGKISLGDKIDVKFGFVSHSVSITFFITGKQRDKKLCISKKLDKLFETSTDLRPLNEYLSSVKFPVKFHYSPYLKINEEPEIFAGMIGIEHKNI